MTFDDTTYYLNIRACLCLYLKNANLSLNMPDFEQTPMLMPRVTSHSRELTQKPMSLYSFLQRRRLAGVGVEGLFVTVLMLLGVVTAAF